MPEPADTGPRELDGSLEPAGTTSPGEEIDAPRQGEVRRLPVPAAAGSLERARPALPAAIAAATGGFLAGVATFVLVRLLRRPRSARPSLRRGRRDRLDVAATRSFLVDIHLLKR